MKGDFIDGFILPVFVIVFIMTICAKAGYDKGFNKGYNRAVEINCGRNIRMKAYDACMAKYERMRND